MTGKKERMRQGEGISDAAMRSLARTLLPSLREFYPKGRNLAGQSRDPEKEPGALKRQAQESFALPNTARFVP